MSPGVATYRGICVRVAIRAGMAESISSGLRESSVSLVKGRVPRATNGGSLLALPHWETGVEAAGEAHCSHYKAPWRCKLTAMPILWEGSVVLTREWVSTGVVVGA